MNGITTYHISHLPKNTKLHRKPNWEVLTIRMCSEKITNALQCIEILLVHGFYKSTINLNLFWELTFENLLNKRTEICTMYTKGEGDPLPFQYVCVKLLSIVTSILLTFY